MPLYASDYGYAPEVYCGDCGQPWRGATPPTRGDLESFHGCCFGYVSPKTSDHERLSVEICAVIASYFHNDRWPYAPKSWRAHVRHTTPA